MKSFLSQQQATENFGALHRKFRIQKDRLVTWGLEWDDEGKGAEGNIDETVARAGLTETVTSVLANVKEVTDELERVRSGVSKPGEKFQPQIFDEERYADLLKDLTASIDTLHDLSRTRRALARGEHPTFSATAQPQPMSRATSLTKRQSKAPSYEELSIIEPPVAQKPVAHYGDLAPRINANAIKNFCLRSLEMTCFLSDFLSLVAPIFLVSFAMNNFSTSSKTPLRDNSTYLASFSACEGV